jgi:hypothetical protein
MSDLAQSDKFTDPFDNTLEIVWTADEKMLQDSGNQVFLRMQKEIQVLQ